MILKKITIFQNEEILILNKPFGLAVQGGTGIENHLDGYLKSAFFNSSFSPRLVHRLDKETTGVLVVALTRKIAVYLSNLFQERKVNRALIDKDAIYTQEGVPVQTLSNVVIGAIQPYAGEFGISRNPESVNFDFFSPPRSTDTYLLPFIFLSPYPYLNLHLYFHVHISISSSILASRSLIGALVCHLALSSKIVEYSCHPGKSRSSWRARGAASASIFRSSLTMRLSLIHI